MPFKIRLLLCQFLPRDRRNERIRIQLSVRMMQGDADFDAPILERIHVLNLRNPAKLFIAIGPHVNQQLEMPQRQASKR